MSNSPRYINLMGDEIDRGRVVNTLDSDEIKITIPAIALTSFLGGDDRAGFMALSLSLAAVNGFILALNRHVIERSAIVPFSKSAGLSVNETLKTLCIDTNPSEKTAAQSVQKYGSAIRKSKAETMKIGVSFNAFLPGSATALTALSGAPPEVWPITATMFATGMVRTKKGLDRLDKLSTGEWAIVTMSEAKNELIRQTDKKESLALGNSQPAFI